MPESYYKPCRELDICNELIEKYFNTQQYKKCFEGHLALAEQGYPFFGGKLFYKTENSLENILNCKCYIVAGYITLIILDFVRLKCELTRHIAIEYDIENHISTLVRWYNRNSYFLTSDFALDKIREIICEFVDIDPKDITLDTNIRKDLGLNSLELVNLAVDIEESFDVEIPDKEAMGLETVADAIRIIEKYMD